MHIFLMSHTYDRSSNAHALAQDLTVRMFKLCNAPLRIPKVHPFTTCFIDHSLMYMIHFLPCVPHHPPTHTCLVVKSPLTGYVPKTCIEFGSEHAPLNFPSTRTSFNRDYNDFITTTDTEEAAAVDFAAVLSRATSKFLLLRCLWFSAASGSKR